MQTIVSCFGVVGMLLRCYYVLWWYFLKSFLPTDWLTNRTISRVATATKKRNRMVNRLKLHNLVQGQEQPVQQYVAALKQIARTCQFLIKCSSQDCNTRVDYSHEMVLDQLVRGLNDSETQRKVCKLWMSIKPIHSRIYDDPHRFANLWWST